MPIQMIQITGIGPAAWESVPSHQPAAKHKNTRYKTMACLDCGEMTNETSSGKCPPCRGYKCQRCGVRFKPHQGTDHKNRCKRCRPKTQECRTCGNNVCTCGERKFA